jgi:hypothetical protein
MKLYASGCSFTWGGELIKTLHDENGQILDEYNSSQLNLHRLAITWPKHLSDLLGCTEFYNCGMGCGSNARIVRKTLDFFVPKVLANENLSDYVAVIQWTEPSRFEFHDAVSNSWAIAKHDVLVFENSRSINNSDRYYLQQHYVYNTDKSCGPLFFSQILTLGTFLKLHRIKYVFTMIHEGFASVLTESQLKYCNDNFNWYQDQIADCSIDDMKVEPCEKSPHPSEVGHKQIAENLHRFLAR